MSWLWHTYRRLALMGFSLIVGITVYAFLIEPNWLEVTHHQVVIEHPALTQPLKIAHLSDLHTHRLGFRERHLLKILQREKPDLIVLTGDNVANIATRGERDGLIAILERLQAPHGVYAVLGNWDHWLKDPQDPLHYAKAKVHLLTNASMVVNQQLEIIGIDDSLAGDPQPARLLQSVAKFPRLLLFHSPELFDAIAGPFEVALAGHTHGGQVRLPFYGALTYPKGSGRFQMGWYEKAGSKLFVSRGIGMSVLPIRFACRPEVAFISLRSK